MFENINPTVAIIAGIITNLLVIGGGVLALVKYIRKGLGMFKKVEEALPTLFNIAEEFNPKGNNNLRQVIDNIENEMSTLRAQSDIILEDSPTPIFIADDLGEFVYVNNAWSATTGITQDENLKNGWTTALYNGDRVRVFNEWKATIKDDRPFATEFRFRNVMTGKMFYVRVRAQTVRNKRKKIVAYIGQLKIIRTEEGISHYDYERHQHENPQKPLELDS